MAIRDEDLKKLQGEVLAVEQLVERKEFDEALAILRRARATLRYQGAGSAWLDWKLAIVSDQSGHPLEALTYIREALVRDPLCPDFRHSRDVILQNLKAILAVPRDAKDPELPSLYQALLAEDAADPKSHVTMARYHYALGRFDQALMLLEALTVVNPSFAEGTSFKAEVLLAMGRHEEARAVLLSARRIEAAGESGAADPTQAQGLA